ncbi:hypothetical protein INT43_007684 [Umbelopsis isabellina]|uniref:Uncharacterized protein n=1 Tax=Mortierella isabellina TaxID=91625 RepID=A0A8H7PNP5_MORIS|nr:hypothetical protein INT43_007684 [Umbelopsis isabellina]
MSSSTESYNQDLQSLFRYYARLFSIDETFMSHGLTLLSRYVDLRNSTYQRIVFQETSHVVHMASCRNIVYLKLWHDQQELSEGNSRTLQVPFGTKLYVGQTANPRARETSLQPYILELGVPRYHICLGHGLSIYHRDALETAAIAWCMFLHGLALLNRSPFSNHFYRNVSTVTPLESLTEADYVSAGSFHNWRLSIIVGTAPSCTVFESFVYQGRRLMEPTPFMDWEEFISWGGLARFRVLIGQVNPPPFIDHWPGETCDLIDDWLRGKDLAQLEQADLGLKRRMVEAHRYLGVMLGARPTRLTSGQQVEKYLTTSCGTLTFSNLQGNNKVAFLWLPHPAVFRYIKLKHQYVLDQLFVCASQAISAIELKLVSVGVSTSSGGILINQAQELRDWWIVHPYSKVLRSLSDNLSTIMASYHIDVDIPPLSTAIFDQASVDTETARLLTQLTPEPAKLDELWYSMTITHLPRTGTDGRDGEKIFKSATRVEDSGINVEGTILFTMNKRFDSYIRKQASRANVLYDVSSIPEQNEILKKSVEEYGLEMRRRFTRKQVRLGKFAYRDHETEKDAMDRCREDFYHQRSRIPTTPGQVLSTCLTCNHHLPRRDVSGGRMTIKAEHGCSCGRTSFTLGWHFLPITAETGTYPANNLFVRHIQTLETPLVINHRQLQASLVEFFEKCDPRDPQLVILKDRYEPLFLNMKTFRPQDSKQSNSLSRFSQSFNDTYRKLEELAFNLDIGINLDFRIMSRQPLPIEKSAYAESGSRTMHVFAFGFPPEFGADDRNLLAMEDLDFMDYQSCLLKVADERRAARRVRDRRARESNASGSSASGSRTKER